LAILDLNLGGVLTYPVVDVLAERGVPFIFATGYGSGGLKEAYSDLPTLQRPFNQEALGLAIMGALGPRELWAPWAQGHEWLSFAWREDFPSTRLRIGSPE
jgi:hypothetical protein